MWHHRALSPAANIDYQWWYRYWGMGIVIMILFWEIQIHTNKDCGWTPVYVGLCWIIFCKLKLGGWGERRKMNLVAWRWSFEIIWEMSGHLYPVWASSSTHHQQRKWFDSLIHRTHRIHPQRFQAAMFDSLQWVEICMKEKKTIVWIMSNYLISKKLSSTIQVSDDL